MAPLGIKKGRMRMFASLNQSRQVAVSMAAAFVVSMLFVSAAIGPLPIIA